MIQSKIIKKQKKYLKEKFKLKNLLFIPCYNDLKNLEYLLNEIDLKYFSNFDILVVNDGSHNKFNLKLKNINLRIINLKNNYGIGFCLKLAIGYAIEKNYQKFCRIDSDNEHDPKYIKTFFESLDNYSFTFGKRNIMFKENFFKILSKKIINISINKLFSLNIKDYHCGMMGFDKSVMIKLQKKYFINYPEPQIILELLMNNISYNIVKIKQRTRGAGISSINIFKGFDFLLVTLFFVINTLLNKNND